MRHFAAATKVLHEFGPDTRLMLLQAQRAGFGAPGWQELRLNRRAVDVVESYVEQALKGGSDAR